MTRHAIPAGSYHVEPLPGQPQVAHCHGFFVPIDRRGMKLGHMLKEHQLSTLVAEHYDYATATVDASNHAQKRMLTKARQILISELALAEKTDEEKASNVLDEVLAS